MWSAGNIIEITKIDFGPAERIKTDWDYITEEWAKLTHKQFVWMMSLEWCESKGSGAAINPKDRDGTPSYYWDQFKPETFRGYGEKYGLIEKGKTIEEIHVLMKSYLLTEQIMVNMISDPDVKWSHEFPACTAKLGNPPKQ
jgi:hypothetical protein